MLEFMKFEVFRVREEHPIKEWFRGACNIGYSPGTVKKKMIYIQLQRNNVTGQERSRIDIKKYPFQNKLGVTVASMMNFSQNGDESDNNGSSKRPRANTGLEIAINPVISDTIVNNGIVDIIVPYFNS